MRKEGAKTVIDVVGATDVMWKIEMYSISISYKHFHTDVT